MLLLQSNPRSDVFNLLPIFVVFQKIIDDTTVFLKEASDQIMRVVSSALLALSSDFIENNFFTNYNF